ncbi:MAG: homoserine dehydrogenase [Dehalococcoidia bacterium]|nr:homoserine dehydrogenase [Dehalococcoidia bacterium]
MDGNSEVNIGLMGLGTVGGGVAAALSGNADAIRRKTGRTVRLRKALVRDTAKARQPVPPPGVLTTNPEDILNDPEIQIVVEMMGGDSPAGSYLERALTAGKHVVTANKEVMSRRGPALQSLAQSQGVNLLFEASAGGGIPIVGCLMSQLLANDIRSIRSIINGTTNYILTRMARSQTPFAEALIEAQDRGYAESDPTNDVEGIDAAYKLSVLGSLAFHQPIPHHVIHTEGISRLAPEDFRYAAELGYAIKSLAIAVAEPDGSVQARVHPALVPDDHLLAKVDGVYNAVEVTGDLCGQIILHGQGAGRDATTSAVMGDILNILRTIDNDAGPPPMPGIAGADDPEGLLLPIDELSSAYYLRLTCADQAGVLAQIARILGDGNISIATVIQKDTDPGSGTAQLVITTYPSRESDVQTALAAVAELGVVVSVNNLIRIEQ